MSALEAFLKRYPDGKNLEPHCYEFYRYGYIDGEMFQFQITKSLEQQIQGHVLEVLKLREELKTLAASGLEAVKYHQAELATLKTAYSAQVEMKMMAMDEIEALRPAAEALKTAVESGLDILFNEHAVAVFLGSSDVNLKEPHNGDPLAATIKAITRAAEAVKENGK